MKQDGGIPSKGPGENNVAEETTTNNRSPPIDDKRDSDKISPLPTAETKDQSNLKMADSLEAPHAKHLPNTDTKNESYTRVVSGSNGDGQAVVVDAVAVAAAAASVSAELSMASSEVSINKRDLMYQIIRVWSVLLWKTFQD